MHNDRLVQVLFCDSKNDSVGLLALVVLGVQKDADSVDSPFMKVTNDFSVSSA